MATSHNRIDSQVLQQIKSRIENSKTIVKQEANALHSQLNMRSTNSFENLEYLTEIERERQKMIRMQQTYGHELQLIKSSLGQFENQCNEMISTLTNENKGLEGEIKKLHMKINKQNQDMKKLKWDLLKLQEFVWTISQERERQRKRQKVSQVSEQPRNLEIPRKQIIQKHVQLTPHELVQRPESQSIEKEPQFSSKQQYNSELQKQSHCIGRLQRRRQEQDKKQQIKKVLGAHQSLINPQSYYYNKFIIKQKLIQLNQDPSGAYFQLLGHTPINQKPVNSLRIIKSQQSYIYFGIINKEYIRDKHCQFIARDKCIFYLTYNGDVFVGKKNTGNRRRKAAVEGDVITMAVEQGKITWSKGEKSIAQNSNPILEQKGIEWVPFIALAQQGDIILLQ